MYQLTPMPDVRIGFTLECCYLPTYSNEAIQREALRDSLALDRDTLGGKMARLYDRKWRKRSDEHRAQNPMCAQCEREGRTTPARLVQLIKDSDTVQSLCHSCQKRINDAVPRKRTNKIGLDGWPLTSASRGGGVRKC